MIPKKIRIDIKERIIRNGKKLKLYWIWESFGDSWLFAISVVARSKLEAYDNYNSFFCGG